MDQRRAYLADACGANLALRHEVDALLTAAEGAGNFLETPVTLPVSRSIGNVSLEGRRIGPYEVAEKVGAGGMGEVYRAHDIRLNRQVAMKVLLPAVAGDPDRLARFSREAQVLASLNHPHIAHVHGLEEVPPASAGHASTLALVMELVEGPTLADRIAQGKLPVAEALTIAGQIAEALEAAHEQGIVHRDLKPTNVKIRHDGTVKVLDFGLAKALVAPSVSGGDHTPTPTPSPHATVAGLIVGTAAYMSPEQARGRPVEKRADIWAFGCVLYEMLTRRRVFDGDTPTDVLAAVLTHEPDWTLLPIETPDAIRTLLRRCLEKERKNRLESAADARLEISDALVAPAVEAGTRTERFRRLMPAGMAALAAMAVIAPIVAWIALRPAPPDRVRSSRFAIVTPAGQPLNVASNDRDVAFSPDGRYLVYRFGGSTTNGAPLMVRDIDRLDARPIGGFIVAYTPFLSPDSRWIGFFEDSQLKKVPIAGGAVVTLTPVQGAVLGASWGDDNTIVFATDDPRTGLWRVSADGGVPRLLTTPDAASHESDHQFPVVLPGSRGVVFTIAAAGPTAGARLAVLDLATGRHATLLPEGNTAEYVDGYLVYATAGAVRAVRFDPVSFALLSDPVTVVEGVMTKPSGAANYAVSRRGTLVYVPEGAAQATPISSLVWVDRHGVEEPIGMPARAYGPPRLSPDGARVALGIAQEENTEIWIGDLARGTQRRLTISPDMDGLPVWTPDGRQIIFMSARNGALNWYRQSADGTGAVERLTTSESHQWPVSITSQGTRVFGFKRAPKINDVIMADLTPAPSGAARAPRAAPIVRTLFAGDFPEISPDGRYLAYKSIESGHQEIYVRPFPQVDGGRWQVSTGGGTRAAWARSGRELFYLDASNTLIAVPVRTSGSTFSMGTPAKVFDNKYVEPNPARHYDIALDGRRFLMLKPREAEDPDATPASMVVVEHWFEELESRVR